MAAVLFDDVDTVDRHDTAAREMATALEDPVASLQLTQRFEGLESHAEGGLGKVSRARDPILRRHVALKEIKKSYASDERYRERFLLEGELTAQLEHPGVVPIYGLGRHEDGRPFYAMRLIRGETLHDTIAKMHSKMRPHRRGGRGRSNALALDLRKLLRHFTDICHTLEYAHQRGVVHRDMKPQNVVLGRFGETIIIDWGAATILPRDEAAESSGASVLDLSDESRAAVSANELIGTFSYMSPEQAQRDVAGTRKPSDIYSLGAILYEILTGRPPFEKQTNDSPQQVCQRIARGEFPRPRRVNPDAPAALEAISLKAMSLRPADRYRSAHDLAADIEMFLADEPVSAWREPFSTRAWRWVRNHRTLLTSGAAVAVVLIAALIVGVLLLGAANKRERLARKAESEERQRAEQREQAVRRLQDASSMLLAQRAWEAGLLEQTEDLLLRHATKLPDGSDARGWEWYYLARLCNLELLTLHAHKMGVRSVACSPGGNEIATGGEDGTIKLWDSATGKELRTLSGHLGAVLDLAYSPDGTLLASAGADTTARIWKTSDGKEEFILDVHLDQVTCLAFSRDGKRLVTASADSTTVLWDTESGRDLLLIEGHHGRVNDVVFGPRDLWVASAGEDGKVQIWHTISGKLLLTLEKERSGAVCALALRNDGQQLAAIYDDKKIRLWSALTGQLQAESVSSSAAITVALYSLDGKTLMTCGSERTIRLWDPFTGKDQGVIRGHSGPVHDIALDSNGTRLVSASSDGTARIWELRRHTDSSMLSGHVVSATSLAFSPDSRRLVSGSFDHSVRLWDVHSGRELCVLGKQDIKRAPEKDGQPGRVQSIATYGGHRSLVMSVAYSPDGSRIASASLDKTVRVWDAENHEELLTLKHPGEVASVAFSPDGQQIATGCWDDNARIWDAQNGAELKVLRGHVGNVAGIAYSPDGLRLASAGWDKTVRVWETQTGKELMCLRDHKDLVNCVAFDSNGRRLASGGQDGTVRIWNAASGEVLSHFVNVEPVMSVAFSANGRRLISSGKTLTGPAVKLWDLDLTQEVLSVKGMQGTFNAAKFSPDGRMIAAAGSDGKIYVWDSGAREASVFLHSDKKGGNQVQREELASKDRRSMKMLGYFTANSLPDVRDPAGKKHFKLNSDLTFLVVLLSLPAQDLIPSENRYRQLQREQQEDPGASLLPARDSVRDLKPGLFKLLLPGGASREGVLVTNWDSHRDKHAFCTSMWTSSSDRIIHNDRDVLAIGWAVPVESCTPPFKVSFKGSELIPVPERKLKSPDDKR